MIRIQQIKLPTDYDEQALRAAAAAALRIAPEKIRALTVRKRSLDARKKPDLRYILTVDVDVPEEKKILKRGKGAEISRAEDPVYRFPGPGDEPLDKRPVIAGSGPAGLFCGLLLACMGYAPLILERGEDVDARTAAVEHFWTSGALDPRSNVQFGEGGAGTFSDGKLNTLVRDRDGRNRFVLETFVQAGADPDILYVNKPHIGTDVLRTVVKNLRAGIVENGGEVRFLSQVTDIRTDRGRLTGITVNGEQEMDCSVLVLAIGHSARDTFEMLRDRRVPMQAKAFAVGLRIEHPQAMINCSQYGAGFPACLPPADYKLTAKLPDGRGVYSFCMCPGGYVVNASSEEQMTAVNGMSLRARSGENANSALVVTVTPQDFGGEDDVLSGVTFQRKLEAFAWRAGRGRIPVQLFEDFQKNQPSRRLGDVAPNCMGGWELANLREGLPAFLSDGLVHGILQFEQKIRGFSRSDALLEGVESRTSSPVRILRGEDCQSQIAGLYPCGEGAGYAGGITSAAMDGMRAAEAIARRYRRPRQF